MMPDRHHPGLTNKTANAFKCLDIMTFLISSNTIASALCTSARSLVGSPKIRMANPGPANG